MGVTAYLAGTRTNPHLKVTFGFGDKVNVLGANNERQYARDWIKTLPRAWWDGTQKCWIVSGIGPEPDATLEKAGVFIRFGHPDTPSSLSDVSELSELVSPIAKKSSQYPGTVLVRPRLLGAPAVKEILGPSAHWNRDKNWFEVPVVDMITDAGKRLPGIEIPKSVVRSARSARRKNVNLADASSFAQEAFLQDIDSDALSAVIKQVGDVPEWFGLDLYEFQRIGAIAAAAGHRLIGDEPGLGKTRQALAAHAILGTRRLLILTPPVSLSHWQLEAEQSRVTSQGSGEVSAVIVRPGRKEPEFPDHGIVITTDSLVSGRQALRERILEWAPDGMIVDEVHRSKTWSSARSKQTRALSFGTKYSVGISGTPLLASPNELLATLATTGHLDTVFGGYNSFVEKYCYIDMFDKVHPRIKALPDLKKKMDRHVWVRREKAAIGVLPQKHRISRVVDVDLKGFRQAHDKIKEKVREWITDFALEHGDLPSQSEAFEYAKSAIGLISPLREAAGLAKVGAAVEFIGSHLLNHFDAGQKIDRPLIVWAHHQTVIEGLSQAILDLPQMKGVDKVPTLSGGMSVVQRDKIVERFQAGKIPVLLASMHYAGVAITLTRASDALFVETDWRPAIVQQAEDRCHRLTSTQDSVTYTTLVAHGTLDVHIHKVLEKVNRTLEVVMGQGNDVSVKISKEDTMAPRDIVTEIIVSQYPWARRTLRANLTSRKVS